MRLSVLVLLLAFAAAANAQGISKEQLASQFYEATTARLVGDTVNNAAAAILREDPKKVRQAEIYKQWALETFGSKEYKDIYIQYFVENYSQEELVAMSEWAKNPLFLDYMAKTLQFTQWSAPRFQQLLSIKNTELVRRLRAEGFDPSK
jgi:hypothetical protein